MPLVAALGALAALAGNTVVTAAVTDAWESARQGFERLLGRGDLARTKLAEERLAETHDQLTRAVGADLERTRAALEAQWVTRMANLLEEDPSVEADLRHPGAADPGAVACRDGVGGRSCCGSRAGSEYHGVGWGDRGRGDRRERGAAGPYSPRSGGERRR